MSQPYPPINANHSYRIQVTDLHELYVEESGNPRGTPVVFVHGGPGGGTEPWHRQFFNPQKYRIILFDQRGCGRSRPHAELHENTTWDLISDMERIRDFLGINRWVVFGGSWGSTLALSYAQCHPQHTIGLILRGIFLLRPEEIRWFYQDGASWIFPDAWAPYRDHIPEHERHDMVAAYYQRLTSDDLTIRQAAASAWATWEGATSKLIPNPDMLSRFGDGPFAEAFARIECHYFSHGGFFDNPNQILDNVARIRKIPGVIVQGRYDVVCPMRSAWELHQAWPEAEFYVVGDAGHAASESGILEKLIDATDRFADLA